MDKDIEPYPSDGFEFIPPKCHLTPMFLDSGDDDYVPVTWWECKHCGHTKEWGEWFTKQRRTEG